MTQPGKHRQLLLTSTILALAALIWVFNPARPAHSQTQGLIPTGTSSLPQGQYMLTNLRTGQSVYIEIDATGRLLAQDPKALSWSVTPLTNAYYPPPAAQAPPAAVPSAQGSTAGDTATDTTGQKQGLWGGLLRQGVETFINNKLQPAGTPAAPK